MAASGFKKYLAKNIKFVSGISIIASYGFFKDSRSVLSGILISIALYLFVPPLISWGMCVVSMRKQKDFKEGLVKYYSEPGTDRLLVCIEVNDKIIGMVAVCEAELDIKGHHAGLRKPGDAEMKRMNILSKYRGQGLSKVLFEVIKQHCRDRGFKRMVLSTSSFNHVACNYLYPKLGFRAENRKKFAEGIEGVFFSMVLNEKE